MSLSSAPTVSSRTRHGFTFGAVSNKPFVSGPPPWERSMRSSIYTDTHLAIIVASIASFPALFRSSEREKHHNIAPSRTHALWKMSTFTRLISIISDRMPRIKRSKEKVQVPTEDSTDLLSLSHGQRPYLETNMLRSVDGNGKFLHSGTFPQKAWLHRVPSDSYVAGDTGASCHSAV